MSSISNNTKKILDSIEKEFGEVNATFYLNGAIEKSEKRKRKNNDDHLIDINQIDEEDSEVCSDDESVNRKIDNNSENDRHQCADLDKEEIVLSAYCELPIKNVTYDDNDRANILKIFNVILALAKERDYKRPVYIAAKAASELLSKKPYYSQISTRTIMRWNELKDKVNERTGKKINVEFESDVWGKLMLCVFEKVRSIN